MRRYCSRWLQWGVENILNVKNGRSYSKGNCFKLDVLDRLVPASLHVAW